MRARLFGMVVVSFVLGACHDSSDSPPFLAVGVNDLGAADSLHAFEDGILAVSVHETTVDLNGDGDTNDSFLEILDVRSGSQKLVPHVEMGYGVTTGAGFVSFLVSEADAGRDLNGDRDQVDVVAHVHDARRGFLRNLGLATFSAPIQQGALVALAPHEALGIDLNGDGDFDDCFAYAYDADRRLLTRLSTAANGESMRISDRRVFYLNDPDPTVEIYDADTGQLRSLPHSTDAMWVEGSLLATLIPEWENGGQDLNGNGSNNDGFVELHDLDTEHVRMTSRNDCYVISIGGDLAVVGLEQHPEPREVRVYDRFTDTLSDPIVAGTPSFTVNDGVSDRRYAYAVSEYVAGADLDGDGELWDEVLHLFDARTGTARNVERAAYSRPQIDERRAAFLAVAEPTIERPPSRTSVHVLDVHTGVLTDTGVMASDFHLVDGRVIALTPEEWQGVDLDGDLALTHTILQVHDLASGETLSTGLTVWNIGEGYDPIVLDGDVLALVVDGRLKAVRLR